MKAAQISMQGGGYYNDNSSLQKMAIEKSLLMFPPTATEGITISSRFSMTLRS
jgi:hypothetical protein